MIPFALLLHGLMGVWGRTSPGIFSLSAYFKVLGDDININSSIFNRALLDIILLAATALVLLWIIVYFSIFSCVEGIRNACKDKYTLDLKFAKTEG